MGFGLVAPPGQVLASATDAVSDRAASHKYNAPGVTFWCALMMGIGYGYWLWVLVEVEVEVREVVE